MAGTTEARENVASTRLVNSRDVAIRLQLEPWGEEYEMPPGAVFEIVARGPRDDALEAEPAVTPHQEDSYRGSFHHPVVDPFEPVVVPAEPKTVQVERGIRPKVKLPCPALADVVGAVEPGSDDQPLGGAAGRRSAVGTDPGKGLEVSHSDGVEPTREVQDRRVDLVVDA
jgi:hypothetical protein